MGTEDKRRQFDEIVAHLIAEDPSLARMPRRRPPRWALIVVLLFGAVAWGLLSVAMVAWGAAGVLLACMSVTAVGTVLIVDEHRRRR
jgi:fatty acid desaturase